MTQQILKAARELGIESKVHVLEDHQLNPLVTVTEGTDAVQSRVDVRWLMESDLKHLKTILADLHRMAQNN